MMRISIQKTLLWLMLAIAGTLLVACGGGEQEPSAPAEPTAQTEPAPAPVTEPEPEPAQEQPAPEPVAEPEPASAPAPAVEDVVTVGEDGVVSVTIGATDQMQYTVNAFTVQAGQEVELTLVHEGQLGVEVMGHNVVILPAGEDYIAFGQRVATEGGSMENEYLPESMREGLIAYTAMIGGGGSDTIRFTAPDTPGEYPFLCSFPGHFGLMNGIMTVQ